MTSNAFWSYAVQLQFIVEHVQYKNQFLLQVLPAVLAWNCLTSVHARTAYNDLLQKRLEDNLYWIICHVPKTTQSVKGLNWTDLQLVMWSRGGMGWRLGLGQVVGKRWKGKKPGRHRDRWDKSEITNLLHDGFLTALNVPTVCLVLQQCHRIISKSKSTQAYSFIQCWY